MLIVAVQGKGKKGVERVVGRAGKYLIRSQTPCTDGRCHVAEVERCVVQGAMIKGTQRHDD